MIDSRLQIRRVHAQYLVPADHPAPGRVKARLDHEITRSLSQVLSAVFSSWFSETDSSLWFVRRLEIDLAVNASGDGEQVTRTLTRQLGHALGDTLQDGSDTNNVVRFPSPAAYLARFLSDLAAGEAWGRWYYESFFGLRMLPTSAALRTAICDQTEKGRAALLRLPGAELRSVLRALSRQDARVILDHLTQGAADGGEFDCHQVAWSISGLVDADSLNPLDEWGRALYVYLSAARQEGRSGNPATDAILELLRCSSAQLRDLAETIHHVHAAQTRVAHTEPHRRYTECGGAFLLLPLLDELPLVDALRDWPCVDEAAAISLVRFLILIKCSGHHGAQRRLGDPVIRDLLVVPPAVSVDEFNDWQARVGTRHVKQFLRILVDWQRRQGKVADRRQTLIEATVSGSPIVLLIDEARAFWLAAQEYSVRQSNTLTDVVHESLSRLEQEGGMLFCDPKLLGRIRIDFPALDAVSPGESAYQLPHEDELSYLALPECLKFSSTLDLALSVAAQHVLRTLAWRLPGFAASNLPYLSSNFLQFTASIEDEPARRIVRLASPPLRLVLSMTGMMRQTYRLSWLDERPLTLFEDS